MSAGNGADLQPTIDVVLGEEIGAMHEPPVTVQVTGIVHTQDMPHKAGATFTKVVATAPLRLFQADHRRARLTLIGSAPFLVAFSSASSQDQSRMALWPLGVPLVILNDSEVWVMAPTATVNISAIVESWASGENGTH